LSMLWDQFVDAKIDEVYRSSAQFYASDKFNPQFVRGSALDISEHAFLSLMWKCWPHAVTSEGNVLRVHSRFQDDIAVLFTQISPYRSAYDAAVTQMECGHRDELERIAGPTFTEWDFEDDDKEVWRERYPFLTGAEAKKSDHHLRQLNFHTLPVCYERGRFMIVEQLPHWARSVRNNRDQEVLVTHLGGQALVIPDQRLKGWDKILSGETPVLESEFLRADSSEARKGRPAKVPRVAESYAELYPDGHICAFETALNAVEAKLGESVSPRTLRRAIQTLGRSESGEDRD
jgi:hypothetical protein